MKSWVPAVMSVAAVAAIGCGGGAVRTGTMPPQEVKAKAVGCARVRPAEGPARIDDVRVSGTVALARIGESTIAYVADEDDAMLHTVDVDTQRELSTTPLLGAPSQLLVAADGRVLVALRDKAAVQVLEPAASLNAPLESRCTVATAVEPLALAITPDDATLLVSSGWGQALGAYTMEDMKRSYQVHLPREPRAVVVSDDGKKAFVAHVVGAQMSVVDLAGADHRAHTLELTGRDEGGFRRRGVLGSLVGGGSEPRVRRACQGFALAKSVEPAGRVFAPQVLVDPGNSEQASEGYGSGGMMGPEVASVAVIDEGTDAPLESSLTVSPDVRRMAGARTLATECLLPRAAAIDAASGRLLVTCLGIDAVVAYDAASADPRTAELGRWTVGSGPTGIAVDVSRRRAVVWSQFDRAMSLISLSAEAKEPVVRLALSRKASTAETADLALGRKLFHATGDTRISNDGRACASCHPDGRDDSLTWATPDGPRQTPMLAGRLAKTAPFGWDGANEDVRDHVTHTFERLRGSGLEGRELDALIAFVGSMQPPQQRAASKDALVLRGSEVFHSTETGCASCHGDTEIYSDRTTHDVGSRAAADKSARFDTPSLRFVGGTAPYFHDGRYPTLRSLLVGAEGKMGHTDHLAKADIEALEAYLRSL